MTADAFSGWQRWLIAAARLGAFPAAFAPKALRRAWRISAEAGAVEANNGEPRELAAVGRAAEWLNFASPDTVEASPGKVVTSSTFAPTRASTAGNSVHFRVSIDGQPPGPAHGLDVDDRGNGTVVEPRLYQLIRQPTPIVDRQFEIEFLDAGVATFAFTFG